MGARRLPAITLPLLASAALVGTGCLPEPSAAISCNTDGDCPEGELCHVGSCLDPAGPEGARTLADVAEGLAPEVLGEAAGDGQPEPEPDVIVEGGAWRYPVTLAPLQSASDADVAVGPVHVALHIGEGHPFLFRWYSLSRPSLVVQGAEGPLPWEIEELTDSRALLWVLVDEATLQSGELALELAAEGNGANRPAPGEVWPGYDAVFHLHAPVDSSARGWPHVNPQGAAWTDDGAFGGAIHLDGVDDWVDLKDPGGAGLPWLTGVSGFTLSAWVRAESLGGDVVSVGTDETGGGLNVSRAALTVREGAATGFARAPDELGSKLSEGTDVLGEGWHQVALVTRLPDEAMATGEVRLYVDGHETAYALGPEHVFEQVRTSEGAPRVASLGADDDGSTLFFGGSIDEVRILPEPMSVALLQAEHAAALPGFATVGDEEALDAP